MRWISRPRVLISTVVAARRDPGARKVALGTAEQIQIADDWQQFRAGAVRELRK